MGGGTALVISANEGVLDHTWQEIYDAYPNVVMYFDFGRLGCGKSFIASVVEGVDGFTVVNGSGDDAITYLTTTADGYPRMPME